MQDLTLVGVDDDGEHLVLAAPGGTRFRLRADDALRLAARRGPAAPAAPAGQPAALTPREIQARLRAGEDAAEIAAATGVAEERVRRYEGPVLAERAHVAERARALPVRWRDGSGRSPALETLVADRLLERGAEGGAAWDAWRREDGAWLVRAAFRAGGRERRATWSLDLQRAHLEALDDEARWLSSVDVDEAPPASAPRLAAVREQVYDVDGGGTARPAARDDAPVDLASRRGRPSPAGTGRDERTGAEGAATSGAQTGAQTGDEAEGEDDAARAEADRRERAGRTLDLLEHLRGRRGRRQPLADPDDEELEALTWAELEALTGPRADQEADEEAGGGSEGAGEDPWDAAGEPPAAHPPASRPEEAVDDGVLALEPLPEAVDAEPATAAADAAPADADDDASPAPRRRRRRGGARPAEDEGVPGQEELLPEPPRPPAAGADEEGGVPADEAERPRPRPSRRGARPSVPSWDDIVFGQRKD
ncbi:septation protein SepH [uncultured Pseudokineococcus sp.]|uniref:septation protein SepH n=1 Tax=uncultured Pseudokineococcus sp. TaxID=1642928 RepID=UPI00262419D6|nr:septation protein SepH [uncultured Pseudokineococcus sp.]